MALHTTGALVEFDACEDFLDYVISHAVDIVGPYGLDPLVVWDRFGGMERAMAADEGATVTTQGSGSGVPDFSGTNVQVAGVDEPDIVKTDGERIVVLADADLIVVDVTGDEPVEVGRMNVDDLAVQSMLLTGDTVLLFGSIWHQQPIPFERDLAGLAPAPATPTVEIVEVDITAEPKEVRTMTIDGAFVSGRLAGDSVRLVVTSSPVGFEWSYPTGSGLRAERDAIEKNQEIVRNSTADNWIPYYIVTDTDGDVVEEGVLFDCERATHPREFSGLQMLSVVTIDPGGDLDVVDATGVLATGETVYSSPRSLYVATQNWQTWTWLRTSDASTAPDGPTTEIHMFDVTDPDVTSYVASGSVDGYLMNQFAMDEHEGMLRVATTTSPTGWGADSEAESRVTVLRPILNDLIRVGMVDGLGETEQIYSVRFLGDVAYVVTFRQTDPLYTIDLSDPRDPKVMGELEIPGYSAYLHPLQGGLMLGVGQDATDTGQIQGTQVSLFDMTDLSNPTRLDTFTLDEGTSSEVEYNHHAFLYWDGVAIIPVQQYWWDEGKDETFIGAIGLRVDESGEIRHLGDLVHPGGDEPDRDWRAQILRSVAIGDSLFTVSTKGIMRSDLESLDEIAWMGF
ncbi:MAG TPA: beta-propeller domain-containing protein [Acidimicrobiia bacterium]|nr:beta-propeller domain-containing protein [Acidimicrobiia bacterium]